jgi:hypothetical protein
MKAENLWPICDKVTVYMSVSLLWVKSYAWPAAKPITLILPFGFDNLQGSDFFVSVKCHYSFSNVT